MNLNGSIVSGTAGNMFMVDDGGEQKPCALYSNPVHAGQEDPYDISDFAEGPVQVTCETYDGSAAWGVSDVSVVFDG